MNRGYLFKKVKVFSGNGEDVLQRAEKREGVWSFPKNELRCSKPVKRQSVF